jgi:hypothetical protein
MRYIEKKGNILVSSVDCSQFYLCQQDDNNNFLGFGYFTLKIETFTSSGPPGGGKRLGRRWSV